MSLTQVRPAVSGNVIALSIVAVFIATLGTVVAFAIAVDDGARVASLIGLVLPSTSAVILALVQLYKLQSIERTVSDLANGRGDAKNRVAIADVVKPEFLQDDAHERIAADRTRLDATAPR